MSRTSDNPAFLDDLVPEVRDAVLAFRADADARRASGLPSSGEIRRWDDAPLVQELFTLNNLLLRVGDRVIARHGLTRVRWMLIAAVQQYDEPPTVSELSNDALLTVQNVSRMVRAMEDEGWVERFRVKGRGRSVFVRLTEKAERLCESAHAECGALMAGFLEGVSDEDVDGVRRTLDVLIGNLDRFERFLQEHGAGGGSPAARLGGDKT